MVKFFAVGKILLISLWLFACASTPYKELKRTPLDKFVQVIDSRVWQVTVGDGTNNTLLALSPLVIGDIIYANSIDGTVIALALATGKKIWQRKLDYELDSTIGGDKSLLFIGDKQGRITALDINTGVTIWQTIALGEITSAPQSDGNIMVVRTTNGKTTVFNVKTGSELWSHTHNSLPFSVQGSAQPLILAQQILIATSNGDIISLDKKNGNTLWLEPITFVHGRTIMGRIVDVDATPLIVGKQMYVVSMHGKLAKLDINTGNTIWNASFSSTEPVIISNNTIVASHEDGYITGFSPATGDKLWQNDKLIGYDLIGPITADDNANIIAVSPRSSTRIIWLQPDKIIAIANVKTDTDYINDSIISLSATKLGILVYSKFGNLSLHHQPNQQ